MAIEAVGRAGLGRRRGQEDGMPGVFRQELGRGELATELDAGPLADRAPALDAVVTGDLGAGRQGAPTGPATGCRGGLPPGRPGAGAKQKVSAWAARYSGVFGCLVPLALRPATAPSARIFAGQRLAAQDQALGAQGDGLGRADQVDEFRGLGQPVAASQHQPAESSRRRRRSGHAGRRLSRLIPAVLGAHGVAAGDHRADLVEHPPGDEDLDDVPPMMKRTIRLAQTKWMVAPTRPRRTGADSAARARRHRTPATWSGPVATIAGNSRKTTIR